jgi:hypothetical protein
MSDIEQPNAAQDGLYATGVLPVSGLSRSRFIFAVASVTVGAIGTLIWALLLGWCVVDAVHHFWLRDATPSRFTQRQIIRTWRKQDAEATAAGKCRARLA